SLLPVGLDVERLVVHEALARPKPDPVLAHVALDDRWRRVALAAEGIAQRAAGVIEYVATTPGDEPQHTQGGEAHAEAVLDGLVDVFGAGHPLLDQTGGL